MCLQHTFLDSICYNLCIYNILCQTVSVIIYVFTTVYFWNKYGSNTRHKIRNKWLTCMFCTYKCFYNLLTIAYHIYIAVILCLITYNLFFVIIFCGCCCLLELQYITMLLLVKLFSCWMTCEGDFLLWVLSLRQLRRGSSAGQEPNPGLAGD